VDDVHARAETWRQRAAYLVGEPDLVRDPDRAGGGHLHLRQVLPAHAGAGAVRPDEHIAHCGASVGEARQHRAVGALLVAHVLGAELNGILQAGQQQPAQCGAVGGVVVLRRVLGTRIHDRLFDHEQLSQLFGEPSEVAGTPRRRKELVPYRVGQAGMQRSRAHRVDVDPVALPPTADGRVPLVDDDVHPCPAQALREAQATDAAPDDDHSSRPAHDRSPFA
jgi:hypothetical protein